MTRKKPADATDATDATPDPAEALRAEFGEEITLYPTGDAFVPDVPAEVVTVDPERAAELLAYSPPAFTTSAPTTTASTESEPSGDAGNIAEG